MIAAQTPAGDSDFPDFASLGVLILGLGAFGGGAGAARFFAERGARVRVTDLRSADDLCASLTSLENVAIERYRLGHHDEADLEGIDWVVVNPGVPPHASYLRTARERGLELVTEIGLFLRWCKTPWVAGITGTNGKSTTATLTAQLLEASGFVTHLGGNIGVSLLPRLGEIQPEDRVVLELSSFQLERLRAAEAAPRVAALTHFSSNNHLDWHGDAGAYRAAKERVLGPTSAPEPVAILPAASQYRDRWRSLAQNAARNIVEFDGATAPPGGVGWSGDVLEIAKIGATSQCDYLLPPQDCSIRGPAQRGNFACAVATALALGADPDTIPSVAREFRGLPHRQEWVGEIEGVRFINDSKATTPEATRVALEAFGPEVHVLVGGRFKGDSQEDLARDLSTQARGVYLFGECRAELAQALAREGLDTDRVHVAETLAEAFEHATRAAAVGSTVLLSPACASFDQFVNYEARGEEFRQLVARHR